MIILMYSCIHVEAYSVVKKNRTTLKKSKQLQLG